MPLAMPAIIGASQQKRSGRPFIIKVNYASGFTVTLPLVSGYNYNFTVDWGDGAVSQVTAYNDADRIHTYASGGTYTIKMTGTLEGWKGNTTGLKEYIVEVSQWGRTGFKLMTMSYCTRLIACYGKLITSQTSFANNFEGNTSMTTVDSVDWDMSAVQSLQRAFWNCTALTTIDVSKWNLSSCVNMGGTFYGCAFTSLDVSNWDVSKVTTFADGNYGTFSNCFSLTSLDCSDWVINTTSDVVINGLFYNCRKITTVGDISGWNVSKVTSFSSMFYYCSLLSSDYLDLSDWNVSNSTSFANMFSLCPSLTSLDLSAWTFKSATTINMTAMFNGCTNLTTIGATTAWTVKLNFNSMFYNCGKLSYLDVSNWDTSGTTNTSWAFYGCAALTSLDVSGWNVSNITIWQNGDYGCFNGCSGLTSIDVSGWTLNTTSNVNLKGLFRGCTQLSAINISGWDMTKVTSTDYMFLNCAALTSITFPNTLTLISASTCKGCSTLATINVGTGVTSVADLAFSLGGTAGRTITYNFYRSTAPTISGTPFPNFNTANNVALHIPAASSSYTTAPWTTDAIFDQPIIKDL
jgi:surface protein